MIDLDIKKYNLELLEHYFYDDSHFSSVFLCGNDIFIVDNNFHKENGTVFDYSKYCVMQNEYMKNYDRVFRINDHGNDIEKEILRLLKSEIINIESNNRTSHFHYDNTVAEHELEEDLVDAFGSEILGFLHKEYEINLEEGKNIYIDYLIQTKDGGYALEANGVQYHHPCLVEEEYYDKLLEKQNTLMLFGYKVFRFSLAEMQFKDQMIDRLRYYMPNKEDFISKSVIKNQRGLKLYEHQSDALKSLDKDRIEGKTTSLIVLPTASGKSEIFLTDLEKDYIKDGCKNILVMVPSIKIKEDWNKRIKTIEGYNIEVECYQTVFVRKNNLPQDYYDYILVDEAHHSQANNVKATIQYFKPKYLLGLTATDERLDSKKLEEIFGEYEVTLSLREAIEKNIITNIRAYRLKSNISLEEIRYNGKDYNYSDLESTLIIDSRNELIADCIKEYFEPGDNKYFQGIVFCVNKRHCEKVSEELNKRGIVARAVYSGNKDNDVIFEKYRNKDVQFLCSCQLINEGWDCPQTSVIVMARPTLSKVLYQQQLGRGLRKYPGKECVYLIDVVDNYQSKLVPWNFNSLFHIAEYTPFMGVINNNFDYLSILGLHEYEMKMENIDIFTFEEKYRDYLSLEQAARELYIGTNTLGGWNKKKKYASLELPVGGRIVPYFSLEDIEHIRKDHPECKIHNDDTILDDFISFIDENTLTFSFKLVFLLSCFSLSNKHGEIKLDELVNKYASFYLDRIDKGMEVDKKSCIYTKEYLNDNYLITKNMLENPFEKFERKRFFYQAKDLNIISFNPVLWDKLSDTIKEKIKEKLMMFLKEYYSKYGGLNDGYQF